MIYRFLAAPTALFCATLALTAVVGPIASQAQTAAPTGTPSTARTAPPPGTDALPRLPVEQQAYDEGCGLNQHNLHVCASYDFRVQDTRLNALYRQQMARLKDAPEDRKRLQDAQRAWLKYTDADCLYQNGTIGESGSIWPMLELTCRTAHWKVRIDILQS